MNFAKLSSEFVVFSILILYDLVTFETFSIGRFVSFLSDGCPDGSLQITELDRPPVGGKWCGSSWGPSIYYSETKSVTLILKVFRLSKDHTGGSNFDFRIGYKMLRKDLSVVRYGGATPSPYDSERDRNITVFYHLPGPTNSPEYYLGDLIAGTYCSRIYSDCDKKICRLQSPNFPGIYPRNMTCYYAVRQHEIPYGKHALITVRQPKGQLISIRENAVLYAREQQQQQTARHRSLKVFSECDEVQDYVTVYDGYTTRDPVLLKFCGGSEGVPDTTSSGPELLVEFTTSPFGTFLYPGPLRSLHGFQLEVQVHFVDQQSPTYLSNKKCEFLIRGTGKGVLESPRHSLSPNTTCVYYLEGGEVLRPTIPTFRPSPGRYPVQYDHKFVHRQIVLPAPRYRVWFSVLKFQTNEQKVKKTEESCQTHLEVWDGVTKDVLPCNEVYCEKDRQRPVTSLSLNLANKPAVNMTLLAKYCKDRVPRTCDHSLLGTNVRYPRPCLLTESFLSHGNSMTIVFKMTDSTALRPVSFKALYEFVDLHQDGESFGTGPCSRKFISRSQGHLPSFAQKFQSPKDVFLFGRGGTTNLRFEGQNGEKVKINIQQLDTGTRPCATIYHQDINRMRCHGNASAAIRIYELPWPDTQGVPRDCLCSGGDGITPYTFTSSSHVVELRFQLFNMNATDDFRRLHFDGTWEFVRTTVCTRSQRLSGSSGEIVFKSPMRTPEEINCEHQPWVIEPSIGRYLYVQVRGIFLHKQSLTYEDILKNVTLEDKLPKCDTRNRISIHAGGSVHVVLCPQPPEPQRYNIVEVFSEGWIIGGTSTVKQPVLSDFFEEELREKEIKSRSVVVEFLAKESGTYTVSWLELSRRKPVLPPEGFMMMHDCQHRCPELDACINSTLWCDGVTHCPSGYDESIIHCYYIFQLPTLYLAVGATGLACLALSLCVIMLRSCNNKRRCRKSKHLKTLPSDSSLFGDKEVIC